MKHLFHFSHWSWTRLFLKTSPSPKNWVCRIYEAAISLWRPKNGMDFQHVISSVSMQTVMMSDSSLRFLGEKEAISWLETRIRVAPVNWAQLPSSHLILSWIICNTHFAMLLVIISDFSKSPNVRSQKSSQSLFLQKEVLDK